MLITCQVCCQKELGAAAVGDAADVYFVLGASVDAAENYVGVASCCDVAGDGGVAVDEHSGGVGDVLVIKLEVGGADWGHAVAGGELVDVAVGGDGAAVSDGGVGLV